MDIWVTVKSLGKRKPALARQAVEVPETTRTLRLLIESMVEAQVQAFEERRNTSSMLAYLMPEEIGAQGAAGKVGFGSVNGEGVPDLAEAKEAAILAYEDGLYKVFLNDHELEALDEPLSIEDGADVAFIRFTMLAGRLW
ncbi:hypothetical protein HUB98_21615 [Paenibacillus barcinonensis]|uniref:Uncharacterized protein n=1 Tax=Paenibacillus barcinonensis TaxID=198119 RepID=A0A2V4V9N8_PAEBA|nr:hypothetical protein [Paenibacillus barcinonensis]PYE42701.1 hypothetical protein DFQ00_13415 [Paenibacillus barcinonensis]QKS58571.1 hypothetical protein HUB98_21615 [Paenibacillus barcinonensis]